MAGQITQRKPGVWKLVVNLGRDTQGIRRRRAFTVHGTRRDAERRLREILTDLDRGVAPPEHITLAEWLDRWMREVIVPQRSVATAERYEGIIRKYIGPALGHHELARLSPLRIKRFQDEMLDDGLSPSSVGLMHIIISGAYRYAMMLEVVQRNPASAVPGPPRVRGAIDVPEVEYVQAMLDLAEREKHLLFPMIHAIAYTGMRRGEAIALTWDDVDLDNGYLEITRSAGWRRAGLVISSPKTAAGARMVDLDPRTIEVLLDHRKWQAAYIADHAGYYDNRGILFADEKGGYIKPNRVSRTIGDLGRKVGHPRMTTHSLRHFHVTMLLQSGFHEAIVAQRAGHANSSITRTVYAHALPGWQREAAEAFGKAMERGA